MQGSIAGSARIQGVGNVVGLTNSGSDMNPGMQKALIMWAGAFLVLVIFHIGGARF